jgi:hypothetical protein
MAVDQINGKTASRRARRRAHDPKTRAKVLRCAQWHVAIAQRYSDTSRPAHGHPRQMTPALMRAPLIPP